MNFLNSKRLFTVVKKVLEIIKYIGLAILGLHINIILWTAFFSLLLIFINPPFTSIMIYREIFYGYKTKNLKYIPLKKIPYNIPRKLVSVEDYTFYKHSGIDVKSMQEAIEKNKRLGVNFYGGSTITQQLTRTLFLIPKKYLIRKYLEIIMAVEIDLIIPKDRILELYLNYVEWGKGVYGIETASRYYYKRSVRNIDGDEANKLLTILSSPVKYNPTNFYLKRIMVYRYEFLSKLY